MVEEAPSPRRGTTTDGRAARAAHADAVVDALIDLIDEGALRPAARLVAERAGVSLRSVYVHFDDLDDLFSEVGRRQARRLRALTRPVDPGLPFAARSRSTSSSTPS